MSDNPASPFANGNPYAQLAQEDFVQAFQDLLPRGAAWPRDPATTQGGMANAIADAAAFVHARFSTLTEIESDPAQTTELLPDWEQDFGLPDPCLPLNATIAMRRGALLARIAEGEDPTPAYFVALAATIGYTVTVSFATSSFGAGWQNTWFINAPSITSRHMHAGANVTGEYLELPGNSFLECVMRRANPGHMQLIFNYS